MCARLEPLLAALPNKCVVRATKLGLAFVPELTVETRDDLLRRLTSLARSVTGERYTVTAWLGDLLVQMGRLRRGQLSTYAMAAGLNPGTLSNAKLVCGRIPISCRHEALSWTHHCEVALAFDTPQEIERWLALAEAAGLAASELRRRIRHHLAGERHSTILAESAPAFRMLRDLRAATRVVEQQRPIWRAWSPSAAKLALEELAPLADFFGLLRAKSIRAASKPGSRRPFDFSNN